MTLRSLLDEAACDAKLKPPDREVCKIKECYPDAKWRKGEWGKVMLQCLLLEPSLSKVSLLKTEYYLQLIDKQVSPHERTLENFLSVNDHTLEFRIHRQHQDKNHLVQL